MHAVFFMDFSLSSALTFGNRQTECGGSGGHCCYVANAGHVLGRKTANPTLNFVGGNTNDNYSLPSNERTNRRTAI